MRIGIIGGLDRNAPELEAVAEAGGHRLESHTGVVRGAASATSLRALVGRADLVFVLTDINSHNAVHIARRTARLNGTPLRIVRRLGAAHLAAYLGAEVAKAVQVSNGTAEVHSARKRAA